MQRHHNIDPSALKVNTQDFQPIHICLQDVTRNSICILYTDGSEVAAVDVKRRSRRVEAKCCLGTCSERFIQHRQEKLKAAIISIDSDSIGERERERDIEIYVEIERKT